MNVLHDIVVVLCWRLNLDDKANIPLSKTKKGKVSGQSYQPNIQSIILALLHKRSYKYLKIETDIKISVHDSFLE
jgi:hypothetical protein